MRAGTLKNVVSVVEDWMFLFFSGHHDLLGQLQDIDECLLLRGLSENHRVRVIAMRE
jgi:hypothetical protein